MNNLFRNYFHKNKHPKVSGDAEHQFSSHWSCHTSALFPDWTNDFCWSWAKLAFEHFTLSHTCTMLNYSVCDQKPSNISHPSRESQSMHFYQLCSDFTKPRALIFHAAFPSTTANSTHCCHLRLSFQVLVINLSKDGQKIGTVRREVALGSAKFFNNDKKDDICIFSLLNNRISVL